MDVGMSGFVCMYVWKRERVLAMYGVCQHEGQDVLDLHSDNRNKSSPLKSLTCTWIVHICILNIDMVKQLI